MEANITFNMDRDPGQLTLLQVLLDGISDCGASALQGYYPQYKPSTSLLLSGTSLNLQQIVKAVDRADTNFSHGPLDPDDPELVRDMLEEWDNP